MLASKPDRCNICWWHCTSRSSAVISEANRTLLLPEEDLRINKSSLNLRWYALFDSLDSFDSLASPKAGKQVSAGRRHVAEVEGEIDSVAVASRDRLLGYFQFSHYVEYVERKYGKATAVLDGYGRWAKYKGLHTPETHGRNLQTNSELQLQYDLPIQERRLPGKQI